MRGALRHRGEVHNLNRKRYQTGEEPIEVSQELGEWQIRTQDLWERVAVRLEGMCYIKGDSINIHIFGQ